MLLAVTLRDEHGKSVTVGTDHSNNNVGAREYTHTPPARKAYGAPRLYLAYVGPTNNTEALRCTTSENTYQTGHTAAPIAPIAGARAHRARAKVSR
jgi:hypothetical protein